ncbi:alpha/beta hydrolase [Acetanaerobacterium elongatum]|uniref:Enterochelin esterase n=1 Tax=Acetanaerobacterium elongatum TaxID=258515 RepID=A0A1H0E2F6_9FIRM|nr:alpha/beta hydrolase-fold protein [Acetanaerobacterium elongatum]SDN76505.1 Enterochelin esterase [Acetanaerobacterium elongatum]
MTSKKTSKVFQNTVILLTLLISLSLFGCAGKSAATLRTASVSDPLKESQIVKLSVESEYMGKSMPVMLYLPKGYGNGQEYPVWYGLHGHGSYENMWIDEAGAAKGADELIDNGEIEPLIMVFPYIKDATLQEIQKDKADDGKFSERNIDQYLSKELISYIDTHYFTKTSSDGRYIGGFSMGGMIALRVGFHHPDLFSKVGGYSAAVASKDYSDKQLEKWLFPNDNFDNIVDIAKFDKEKGFDKLTVYLDVGKNDDSFSPSVKSLYEALQKRGIKSELTQFDGGHTLRQGCIKDYLKFYAAKN